MTWVFLATIIGSAVFDSINPTLFIVQFYLLSTPAPLYRTLSYIAGVTAVNYTGGVLLLAGLGTLIEQLLAAAGSELLYGLGLLLGLALLGFGLWLKARPAASAQEQRPRSLHPAHAFLLGAAVMLNEISTSLPYFIAIERMVATQLPQLESLLALALYNLVFSLPLLGFLVTYLVYHKRFTAQIEGIRQRVQLWSLRIMKYGSIGVGALLTVAALTFFGTGEHLLG